MKHHLFSIGVSEHQNAFNNLHCPAKDASDFYDLVVNSISSLGKIKLLIDNEATLENICLEMNEFIEKVNKEDSFFLFFSGHGTIGESKDDSTIAEHYLVPYDATNDIINSCLSVSKLKLLLNDLESNINIIFIDACFSGAFTQQSKGLLSKTKISFLSLKTLSSTISGEGNLTVTACRDNEEALEDYELGNSLFSYFLFEELTRDRVSSNFPIIDLYSPVYENVKKRAKNKYHHNQSPTLQGSIRDNLYLPVFRHTISKNITEIDIKSHPVYLQLLEKHNKLAKEYEGFIQKGSGNIDDKLLKNIKVFQHKAWIGFSGQITLSLISIDGNHKALIRCSAFPEQEKRVSVGDYIIFDIENRQFKIIIEEANFPPDYIVFSIY